MSTTQTKVKIDIHHVTVMNAIQSFMRIALAGLSPQTKKWYSFRLDLLARHLGETRPLVDVLEVDLLEYREKLEKKKLSTDTLHGYIRAFRRLFKWLHRRNIIPVNIAEDIHLPKLPKRGRQGISDENAAKILEAARLHSDRDYAMLLFFAVSNARRGGVAALRLHHINLNAPEPDCRKVVVFEKGGKERSVFIDDITRRALLKYLEVRVHGSDFVFTTDEGTGLKPSSVSEIIDRYKERLGIIGKCSPHQWRHRWFRRRLQNKMPITQAAQIGGHGNIKVTYDFYGQFANDELQEAYDRYNPPEV